MTETEIVSLEIDDINNLFYQHVETDSERISPPNGTLVPTSGAWVATAEGPELKYINDIIFYQQKHSGIPGSWPKLYNMFLVELPTQGIVRLEKLIIRSRFILTDGDNSALTWYIFNNETSEWEDFTEQIEKSDDYILDDYTLDLSKVEDISPYFDSNNKFAIMIYLNQSPVDPSTFAAWNIDYFRVDLTYCVPYYCSVADVREVSNLMLEEMEIEPICKFIHKAQHKIIDPKLAGVYNVPWGEGNVPEKIRWLAADLAAGYSLRKNYIGTSINKTEYGDQLIQEAMDQLEALANGDEEIPDETGTDSGPRSNTDGTDPIFNLCDYPDVCCCDLNTRTGTCTCPKNPCCDDDVEGA